MELLLPRVGIWSLIKPRSQVTATNVSLSLDCWSIDNRLDYLQEKIFHMEHNLSRKLYCSGLVCFHGSLPRGVYLDSESLCIKLRQLTLSVALYFKKYSVLKM